MLFTLRISLIHTMDPATSHGRYNVKKYLNGSLPNKQLKDNVSPVS